MLTYRAGDQGRPLFISPGLTRKERHPGRGRQGLSDSHDFNPSDRQLSGIMGSVFHERQERLGGKKKEQEEKLKEKTPKTWQTWSQRTWAEHWLNPSSHRGPCRC